MLFLTKCSNRELSYKAKKDSHLGIFQVADKGLNCARNIYAATKETDPVTGHDKRGIRGFHEMREELL